MSDCGPIWTAQSRSRAAHYRLPYTRASCSVHQRGSADMRLVRRGARANENWLGWPSALSTCPMRKEARHRQQALGQRPLALRAPRSLAKCRDTAAPAQRFRGRTLEDAAPTPRSSRNHCAAATQHHCCQPEAIAGCTLRCRQPCQHWRQCGEREHDREDLAEPDHHARRGPAGPLPRRHQRAENRLRGSFYFTCGVRPSYWVRDLNLRL